MSIIDPDASGAPEPSWQEKAGINEEFRTNPTIAQAKDINGLVKMTIDAQSMVGADKILAPKEDWTESDWNQHYEKLGRPEDKDGYSLPDYSKWENVPEGFDIKEDQYEAFKDSLHKHGVSKRQGDAIIQDILQQNVESFRTNVGERDSLINESTQKLKDEFGDNFSGNIEVAESVLKKFGSEDLGGFLRDSGLDSNYDFVKFLVDVGKHFTEDSGDGGQSSLGLSTPAAAQQEIENLKRDEKFTAALTDINNPQHKYAKEKWENLFKTAFPNS